LKQLVTILTLVKALKKNWKNLIQRLKKEKYIQQCFAIANSLKYYILRVASDNDRSKVTKTFLIELVGETFHSISLEGRSFSFSFPPHFVSPLFVDFISFQKCGWTWSNFWQNVKKKWKFLNVFLLIGTKMSCFNSVWIWRLFLIGDGLNELIWNGVFWVRIEWILDCRIILLFWG
jgi:hypothetical protein